MELLHIQGLRKEYPRFTLNDVSLSLEQGYIMGFIGRNGAGKTTTLKTMLGLVHKDAGHVRMMGRDFSEEEFSCKQDIGVVFGKADYYPKKRLKDIAQVVRRFYKNWDEKAYAGYLDRFALDPAKRIEELSDGMRVKYALTLALSHNAKLLLLDEPTSGLDPVSRDDLLDLFRALIEDGERSILFSTHITSDLEKCADYVTYIRDGEIVASDNKDSFVDAYRLIQGSAAQLTEALKALMIGYKLGRFGYTGLIRREALPEAGYEDVSVPDLESIMIYHERKGELA